MKKGTKRTEFLLVTLFVTVLGACTPEATAPQGGAGTGLGQSGGAVINRVVPMVMPDVWCSAASDTGQDSTAAKNKNRPRPACDAPKQSTSGRGSPTWGVDSTLAASDTTK